jgi:hypothetical protein
VVVAVPQLGTASSSSVGVTCCRYGCCLSCWLLLLLDAHACVRGGSVFAVAVVEESCVVVSEFRPVLCALPVDTE